MVIITIFIGGIVMTKGNVKRVESVKKHLEAAYKQLEVVNKGYNDQWDSALNRIQYDLLRNTIDTLDEVIRTKKES